MQNFTSAQCTALPTFTGSNEDAVETLVDTRNGGYSYQVAKLADGNCWMLENLKLGSTTGDITLTPEDSDVATNFTLPQLTTTGPGDYDAPKAYGPVPGDTGAGATNYGYLYNFSASTAGETRSTLTDADGDAPYSICPAGWKLPTGGAGVIVGENDFSRLDLAFGGEGYGAYGGESLTKWQSSGPLRGVLSGFWSGHSGVFGVQGLYGALRSSTVSPDNIDVTHFAYFYSEKINPGDYTEDRSSGMAIRCLRK